MCMQGVARLAVAHTNCHALSTPFLSSYIALGIADIRHPLSSAGAVNAWELPCNEAAHSSVSVRGTAKKPHSESYLWASAWGYQLLSPYTTNLDELGDWREKFDF